ncbi:hypothetical protein EX895_005091 [Sporisorium graminicola]|uniref:AB hydrolase-1 domain-containing protein n=1 Tax=Sporisorium graminicola TaxID=280036 RepID=A0A4U7KQJ9_9BASI|nr:hypothetical protein EX895_005091 [Sporisorium graminicola]TKY86266.1 hypothetical protein EX895_005091 [Sporisorium graminicola]
MKIFDPTFSSTSSSAAALALSLATALLAAAPTVNAEPGSHVFHRPSHLQRRQAATNSATSSGSSADQKSIYEQAFTDPVAAAKAANALPFIAGQYATGNLYRYNLAADNGQLPWNTNVPFIPEAAVDGSMDGGWKELPDIQGMTLNRTFAVQPGVVMPFYQTTGYDGTKIKRAVMIMPGKPRDCWKYTSLVQNALNVYITNPQSSSGRADGSPNSDDTARTAQDEVLLLGPCWMNEDDHTAGAIQSGELYWHSSQWQSGMASRGPGDTQLSSYQVMDSFMDTLFDKTQFPALEAVVVAGHSMGAQMVQRYSVVKQPAAYDGNITFWIGNPGSYAWLDSSRPNHNNASCATTFDEWAYGLDGSGVPPYARSRVRNNKQQVVSTFQSRNVHLNYGLLDNGQGDTACAASYQGANHLERGCHFVESVANLSGGSLPKTQTANFMPNVSHQDYSMLSYNISLYRLFEEVPAGASSNGTATAANGKGGAKGGASTASKGNGSGKSSAASMYKAGIAAAGVGTVLSFGVSLF